MKVKFFILTFLTIFLSGAVNLSAFCIYNNTDAIIHVYEYSGGRIWGNFNDYIYPGKKSCCNWKNKGCNKKHKRDSKLKFEVSLIKDNNNPEGPIEAGKICKKTIKAGGELIVTGKKGKYNCRAKGY